MCVDGCRGYRRKKNVPNEHEAWISPRELPHRTGVIVACLAMCMTLQISSP